MTEDEAYDCGAWAAHAGFSIDDCPRMAASLEAAWKHGWGDWIEGRLTAVIKVASRVRKIGS